MIGGRSSQIDKIFLLIKNRNIKNFQFYKIDLNKKRDNNKLVAIIKSLELSIFNFAAQAMVEAKVLSYWLLQYKCFIFMKFTEKIKEIKSLKKFVHVSTPEV